MSYLIEVRIWGTGSDEAEELALKIADTCRDRGLAVDSNDPQAVIRSMVSLKKQDEIPYPRTLMEASQGAQLIIAPAEDGSLHSRP